MFHSFQNQSLEVTLLVLFCKHLTLQQIAVDDLGSVSELLHSPLKTETLVYIQILFVGFKVCYQKIQTFESPSASAIHILNRWRCIRSEAFYKCWQ